MAARRALLTLFLLLSSIPAAAQQAEHGLRRYLLVLREEAELRRVPGRPISFDPELQKYGAKEVRRAGREVVIDLPPGQIEKLRHEPSVLYLARINMGFPDDARELVPGTASGLRFGGESASVPPEWQSGAYEYDGAGNIVQIGNDTYAYDQAQRLVSAVVNGAGVTYTYDSFGNRLSTRFGTNSPLVTPVDPASNESNRRR